MGQKGKLQKPIEHGTYNGWASHQRNKIPIDKEDSCGCRAAKNEREKAYHHERRALQKKLDERKLVWERAMTRLAERHPTEAKELLKQEQNKRIMEVLKASGN